MSSLIPGYNYDIFISYRQKDNKYDGWVTEFVDNIKKELEATFKEEISVYFDINPHDGLLETHDVDESLKEKLKCLVFIPIISHTYCDPKSFAWQHEFCAFNKLAKEDKFGRDIRLSSGNVSSRILPVKIHDLDPEDQTLLENELGGVLRGIEFIYKEPGVNRPLRANEDNPDNNLNKTYYRNQLNKIANAVKEIINALKKQSLHPEGVVKEELNVKSGNTRSLRTKIILGSTIALVLIILGFILVPKFIKPKEQPEKSIAVLPFDLLSDEPDKQYLADGMMDAILLHLSKIENLRVIAKTSVQKYREPGKTIPEIGRELNVEFILEGSFQKSGDNVKLIVQLIKAREDDHIWSNEYDRNWNNVFSVQSEVARAIARELKTVITPEEKQLIETVPTTNLTAYDYFLKAKVEHFKYIEDDTDIEAREKAKFLFRKTLENDSTFAQAYSGLASIYLEEHEGVSYFEENYLDSALILSDIALQYNKNLEEAYLVKGDYYQLNGDNEKALEEYEKTIRINPNYWQGYNRISNINKDYVGKIENLFKAANLVRGSELVEILESIVSMYIYLGFTDEAKDYCKEIFSLQADTVEYLWNLNTIDQFLGNFDKVIEGAKRIIDLDSSSLHKYGLLYRLGYSYSIVGNHSEAYKYWSEMAKGFRESGLVTAAHRLGYSFWQSGKKEEGEKYFQQQISVCQESIKLDKPYASGGGAYYDLAGIYAYKGEKEEAYQYLEKLIKIPDYQFSLIWWSKYDPMFDSIRNEERFQKIQQTLETKFQTEHERVRKWLEEQGML